MQPFLLAVLGKALTSGARWVLKSASGLEADCLRDPMLPLK